MNIQKIEKPCNGWTIEYLKNYTFSFVNSNVISHKDLIIFLLNKYLPYFYQVEIEKKYLIYINEEYVVLLKQASKRNYFNQDILNSIISYHIIPIKTDIINQIEEDQKSSNKVWNWEEYIQNIQEQHKIKEQEQLKKIQQKKENISLPKLQQKRNFELTENNGNGGIYGIYSVDGNNNLQLLYIGLTTRPFEKRWEEHRNIIMGKENIPQGMEKLYSLLINENNKKYLEFKILVSFNKMISNRPISQSEKEAMEFGMIYYFNPPGNTSGRTTVPYYFSDTNKTININ